MKDGEWIRHAISQSDQFRCYNRTVASQLQHCSLVSLEITVPVAWPEVLESLLNNRSGSMAESVFRNAL